MPLFRHPQVVRRLCEAVAAHMREKGGVQAVAGLEARGESSGRLLYLVLVLVRDDYEISPSETNTTPHTSET